MYMLECYGYSDIGRRRTNNEDALPNTKAKESSRRNIVFRAVGTDDTCQCI